MSSKIGTGRPALAHEVLVIAEHKLATRQNKLAGERGKYDWTEAGREHEIAMQLVIVVSLRRFIEQNGDSTQ
jgi:hypothetical protein